MRYVIGMAISLILGSPFVAKAESGGMGEGPPANNAFGDLNASFIKTYSALAARNQKATRPILITMGPTYQLFGEDGSVKTSPPANPVENQLKAVAHVAAYYYAAADTHWRDPNDTTWKQALVEARGKINAAIRDIDKVTWSSDAWPGKEEQLKKFVRASLESASDLTISALAKNKITKEDYHAFATKYTPVIESSFYLNSLSNAFDTLKVLKQWKQEMGDDAWSRMRVVVAAGKGRSTAGLTPDTNPAAVTMASIMSPDKVKTNLMMAPAAATIDDAFEGLGLALTSNKLADAAFLDNPQAEWFYTSLKHPDIPVALEPVRTALKQLEDGTSKESIDRYMRVDASR